MHIRLWNRKAADESEDDVNLHSSFAVLLFRGVNDDLLDQLVKHGRCQHVGIAVLPNGMHEAINVVRVVLIGNKLCFPEGTRSAAERRKRVAQSVREEALRRLELSARTAAEFQSVVSWYDREEQSRMRRERRYESLRGDTPVEYLAPAGGDIVPHSMSCPTFRQICRGEFDDLLCNCPFRMHDLTDRAHLRQIVMNLKQDHKEILYFLGVRLYSAQQLALLRGQTERNIRKVRGTVQRKIHKQLYVALTELSEANAELTHQEQAFLKEYKPAQRRRSAHDGKPV